MLRKDIGVFLTGIFSAILCSEATPHHSAVMFDNDSSVSIIGTIRALDIRNPHSYIWVTVPSAGAQDVVWAIEGPSALQWVGSGLTRSTAKVGDKVTMTLHPLKDGRSGGLMVTLVTANGEVVDVGRRARPASP